MNDLAVTEYDPPLKEWSKEELIEKVYELGGLLHKEYEINRDLRLELERLIKQEEYSNTIIKLVNLIR